MSLGPLTPSLNTLKAPVVATGASSRGAIYGPPLTFTVYRLSST